MYLQLWHSFDDLNETASHDQLSEKLQSVEVRNVVNIPPSTSNPFTCSLASKVHPFPSFPFHGLFIFQH
jgi:hypothetical protein